MGQPKLNAVYFSPRMKRRYEVWFLRCGLADGSGAWWFRYLLLNLGRKRATGEPLAAPAQVWAAWFPRGAEPCSFIQGFPPDQLRLSARGAVPFHCHIGNCGIEHDACWGDLRVDGHEISWKLRIQSSGGSVLSDKGWIGFSRSPHADARFSGEILFDRRRFAGEPLGFGVQGHNCGYRHRTFWRWTHACFPQPDSSAVTFEALVYDLPFGMIFRNAVLGRSGKRIALRRMKEQEIVRDAKTLRWVLRAESNDGTPVEIEVEASAPGIHRLPYLKTDGSGTFPVANASLARARLKIGNEILESAVGAVLEMGGV